MKIFITLLALFLVGCASLSASDRLFFACSGYATALSELTKNKASLSTSMIDRVDTIRPQARQICGEQNVAAVSQIEGLVSELVAMRKK